MSHSSVVLVTGASGFIGSHVVVQLLDAGYRVKGTARGAKLDLLREHFKANPKFEAVQIDDIVSGDFATALKDVNAVIHVASPLAGHEAPEAALNGALEGTINVLRQSVEAGVYKVVLTSSWATTLDPSLAAAFAGVTFTENDWGNTSREDLLAAGRTPLYVYCGTKTLAEQAAWRLAEEHPELDIATINPPFVYGAPVAGLTSGGVAALGTNGLIYQLIAGEPGRALPLQLPPFFCNVRDVARAHVLALGLPKLVAGADVWGKRFLVAGPGEILWADAVRTLLAERPTLKDRLPTLENPPPLPGPLSTIDTTRAREALGVKEYVGKDETVLETVDALLELEKTWN
ncbi:hypothetical protein GSI_11409 [Ganoderma sinense ZZ0214-1]|uniref:NAD-dependent epimerase/dehydratase domain-containing protein n=1 Tax=Ganoderma sinense ZZ0214-1 TaxID=1077348 RepID=A0A2G8RVX4_9APHY|nr:hypothetical protein GSI_11409 [Ganoderma sinense ZZ0214-1]